MPDHPRSATPPPSPFTPGPAGPTPIITVRRLAPTDSISELTRLLHRAYAEQIKMGLRPLAGRQDDDTTRARVFAGECYVAVHHIPLDKQNTRHHIVGTILFHEVEDAKGPPWFERPNVASFSQFAVDPDYQGMGLGQMLLGVVEERARETGAEHLALSMAEPDTALMKFYTKRGYTFVEHWQWPYTNYKSAILSKPL
jgi:GNAT superfamily N-acetyltransferase